MNVSFPDFLVTGCSGFVGTHLMSSVISSNMRSAGLDLNSPARSLGTFCRADIRDTHLMSAAARELDCFETIVHLAAVGEVLIPFGGLPTLHDTNVLGTANVLKTFDPSLFIFASSSSVYGDKWHAAAEGWESVCPVGSYGASKLAGELLSRDWAIEQSGRKVVSLRLANIIGPACRGLLRYICEHALRFPQAEIPARLRGGGVLVRDYVPVETVTAAILKVCESPWQPGVETINISSGIGLTNKEILELALPEIEREGLKLRVEWSSERGNGESQSVILNPAKMENTLGIPRPTRDQVFESVRESVRSALAAVRNVGVRCAS